MRRKLLMAGLAVFFIVTALLFFSLRGEKDEVISAAGIVEGTEVNLSSKVSGRISGFCCREGDRVAAGAVLLRLESDEIRASVEQARAGVFRARADVDSAEASVKNSAANLKSAEAEIKRAEAELERSRVQMEEAERQRGRAERLFRDGFISKEDMDLAVTSYESSKASLGAAEARLQAALSQRDAAASQMNSSKGILSSSRARVREAEASLMLQGARLKDTEISTPISGTVVFKGMEAGEVVVPGVTILSVVDMEDLWVRIDMEETFIGYVTVGDLVDISIEGLPGKSFKGTVSEIGREADFATQRDVTRGRQDIKTFRVKVKVTDKTGTLKPGMTVRVEIPKKSS